jgi:PhnB protein
MAVSPIPAGFHTVTPSLSIRGAAKAIDFYKKVFGATEVMRMPGPDGESVAHAEIKIGDSHIMLGDEWPGMSQQSPSKFGGTTVSIMLYLPNADAVFNGAVAAGAKVIMPMTNMFWGDRFGKVQDPFGHEWALATHVEDVAPEEMGRRAAEWQKQMANPK